MDPQVEDIVLDCIEERSQLKREKKKASKKEREARKKIKKIDKDIMEIVEHKPPEEFPVEVGGYLMRVEDKLHVRLKKPIKDHRSEFVSNAIKYNWIDYLGVYTSGLKSLYPSDLRDHEAELVEEDLNIYTTDDLKITEVS